MFRRWLFVYIGWIAICALLFAALRHADDPSRRAGRIQSNDAGRLALQHLGPRYRGYEAVHVAGEGGRWVVLCDAVPHTGLSRAVVVELRASDGQVVRARPPVRN
ncbi:MAG TPA: hypothetical protein VJ276_26170 [Thermoanaerobaculia bacterium]|nr:hypothetical protein [Thermoanaerobaculia bacterium]